MLETILDYARIALYVFLAVLGLFLFEAWNKDHPPQSPPVTSSQPAPTLARSFPQAAIESAPPTTSANPQATPAPIPPTTGQLVTVTTDLLRASIDTRGGTVTMVQLLKYPESLNSKIPFTLLNNDPSNRYIAESGLLSASGPDSQQEQALYTPTQTNYQLAPNQTTLDVALQWQNQAGLKVVKHLIFARNSYEVKVRYDIQNQSTQPWRGNLYAQLLRTNTPPPNHGGVINLSTFFGAAISTPQKPFEKITFKDMHQKNIEVTATDGWAAMIQHYFISAWVPEGNGQHTYYSRVSPDGLYTIGLLSGPIQAGVGESTSTTTKLYTGPTSAVELEKTAPTLKLTIDYGWFWFISGIIFWMMQKIYDVIGNWGWSIVLVTIIIKLLFYQLSAKSYRSMSSLKRLQPRIEMLKERYGDDRQKLTQATLELYRQEKVNPMSGCLPILIQIPVFIALYWVLVESVQLRQAPFMLWIRDLSQHDPYYVLPVLMGISMFIQQRLNPPPPDPLQAKVMMLMPVIFTVLFMNFPAGLMLYWFVNNTLSFLQQWYIMRKLEKESVIRTKA